MRVSRASRPVLGSGGFIGTVRTSAELDDFWVKEMVADSIDAVGRHTHETAHLLYVLEGRYRTSAEGVETLCQPRTLIYVPPGTTHDDRFHDSRGRFLTVSMKPHAAARIRQVLGADERAVGFSSGIIPDLGARLLDELRTEDTASLLVLEGLTLEILGQVARRRGGRAKAPAPWLRRVEDALRARFAEQLSIDEIAAIAGVHKAHLVAEFRRRHGVTIGDYVRRLRIDFARRALGESDTTLAEIATEAGFYDQGHFSRSFKQQTGLTPSQYRAGRRSTRL